ncbi:MAG TPA: hypothetical protein VK213_06015 [Bacteroidales bacterium]|nr:hypothetical protein [Bacteroidales bacterium]
MKHIIFFTLSVLMTTGVFSQAQQFEQSFSSGGQDTEKPRVRVGADFAMQFQSLSHHADTARLIPLGKGIVLPTANLNIEADLADGIIVNLTTYLSARHHNEAWVKGGYLYVDKLPFIKSSVVTRAMDFLSFRAGVMEINYGDAHFRRTDNGNAIRNPFVGNYIIDAFTTTPALEVYFNAKDFLLMGAVTTGIVNPSIAGYNAVTKTYSAYDAGKELAYYGKIGYDKEISDDFRFRLTLSGYHAAKSHSGSLHFGDRAGSRFYLVMNRVTYNPNDVNISSNFTSGNWGPGSTNKDNSAMLNLFTKFHGAEFFGTLEKVKGTLANGTAFDYGQYAVEGLYRFGGEEQFYAGVKYNAAKNETPSRVNRLEVGAGWFPVKNIVIKAEYVDQNYKNFGIYGGGGGFNGVMIESGISF